MSDEQEQTGPWGGGLNTLQTWHTQSQRAFELKHISID